MYLLRDVRFTERGATPNADWRPAQRDSWTDVGRLWHNDLRPKHFTHQGAREYGYAPRSGARGSGRRFAGSYTQRKLKKFGHTKPLVYTGEGEALTRVRVISSNVKRVQVKMTAARKFNFRNPFSNIKMAEELRATSKGDVQKMTNEKAKRLVHHLNRITKTKTTKI